VANFEELAANSGVDTLKPGDAWVIIPKGGANQVFLRESAGYALSMSSEGGLVGWANVPPPPQSRDPKNMVASVSRGKNDQLLKLTARKPGKGRLHAKKGGLEISIGFSVHPKKTLGISFFFLADETNSGIVRRSKFTSTDTADWVKELNSVYGPQANIWFDPGKADPLPLPNLPQTIASSDAPMLEAKKDGAPINVFLAGKVIRSNESDFPNGFYAVKENLIVVKDQEPTQTNGKPMIKTIAHEIAHLLNFTRKIATAGHDYYKTCGYQSDVLGTRDGRDIKIPHQRVLDWNPW
jgi:hypothetical protein